MGSRRKPKSDIAGPQIFNVAPSELDLFTRSSSLRFFCFAQITESSGLLSLPRRSRSRQIPIDPERLPDPKPTKMHHMLRHGYVRGSGP